MSIFLFIVINIGRVLHTACKLETSVLKEIINEILFINFKILLNWTPGPPPSILCYITYSEFSCIQYLKWRWELSQLLKYQFTFFAFSVLTSTSKREECRLYINCPKCSVRIGEMKSLLFQDSVHKIVSGSWALLHLSYLSESPPYLLLAAAL